MAGYTWVRQFHNTTTVPCSAVIGGRDTDGSPIYIGRAHFHGDQLPCKVIPSKRAAYVSHNCREHLVSNYEILCESKLQWVSCSGGMIPAGAVQGGRTTSGEILYIGRTYHNNSQTIGKVHPSHGCLYIPYGGGEVSCRTYEILVYS